MQTGKLTPVLLSTGITINTQRVSPMLAMEAGKIIPEPQPPAVKVMIGDVERMEPNSADPDYLAAHREWNFKVQELSQKLIILRGTVVNLTDEQKEQVNELRLFWETEMGAKLSGSDEYIFVNHIAIGSEADLTLLIGHITGQSMPTPEAVDRAESTFPSNVQGA